LPKGVDQPVEQYKKYKFYYFDKLRKKYHYLLCTAYLDKVGLHLEKHHSGYPKIKNSQTHKIYKKVEN
jgi:hypothetical protein